jgi:hypothetical protein
MQARADESVPKQQRLLGAATAPTRPPEMLKRIIIPDAPPPSKLDGYLIKQG